MFCLLKFLPVSLKAKKAVLVLIFYSSVIAVLQAQFLYFPPVNSDNWATVSPASLGYCTDRVEALYDMLEKENSKAFILLKDGRIVLEKYFDGFGPDSVWYWASAGKSLTAFLVGLAVQEGKIDIDTPVSGYLGGGWTSAPSEKENLITVRNQLTMTTGLDDTQGDRDCTDPECLRYLQDAGTRWAYHNAPYTLLDKVMESATGQGISIFALQRLRQTTGITGTYVKLGFNNVYFSRPRSMARFGLLMLNKGKWGNTAVMTDSLYYNAMVNSSQQLNPSYGYLWWLNGKSSFMVPQLQFSFPGFLFPDAPADCIAALGRDGQMLHIVPSQNLIWIRMGQSPESVPVPYLLANRIWQMIRDLTCTTGVVDNGLENVRVYPDPAQSFIQMEGVLSSDVLQVYDIYGNTWPLYGADMRTIDIENFTSGLYIIEINRNGLKKHLRFFKI